MKKISSLLSILLIIATIYWSFTDMIPSKNTLDSNFSLKNALHHLKNITQEAHYVGSDGHSKVQNYIVDELIKLGLEAEIQTHTAINNKWFAATTTENIIARVKGTKSGKALMLLTHYDSSPHSSLGASDAGSGVVTILEGIRVFLANNKQPKNDIIILISDAEELGLLGAKAFVDSHPWANNIGLVLNFEARGSGGPSYMLMETNGKNGKLLSEFMKAKPNYPAASSLMYSVYKKLPNDTDLTVFREDANINGFNFAFIDDHFDYHTAQDSFERLDRETLLHQADYLTTTLAYFSNSNLDNFNSNTDFIYVNFPFIKLLTYPFSWSLPLLIIAIILFFMLLFFGVSLNKITLKGIFKSFVPLFLSLILCGGISYGLWELLLIIHPQYQDMLHGFTYNGYQYIGAFVLLNLWILFKVYASNFKNDKPADVLIAPIFMWLVLNVLIHYYIQGAGFFIIPVFAALLILAISVFMNLETKAKPIVFTIVSIPTMYIFAPMVKMFPVGLGLKSLFISAIFVVLIFVLITPIFFQPKSRKRLTKIIGFATIVVFFIATKNSGFSIDKKKPNSIVYIENYDDKSAYFGTYNTTLDEYTKQVFDDTALKGSLSSAETKSKYNTRFTYHKKTPFKSIETATVSIKKDTLIGEQRHINLTVTPQRKVNKIEFVTKDSLSLSQFKVNGVLVHKHKPHTVKKGSFLVYHLGNQDKEISLSFRVNKNDVLDLTFNEISYDLLSNKNFSLQPRSEAMMPMPFVTNDAIILTKRINL